MNIYRLLILLLTFSNLLIAQKFNWAKGFTGTPNSYYSERIITDNNRNIYVMGYFKGTVDFDPSGTYTVTSASTPTTGIYEPYLCKLDSNGNFMWVRTWKYSYNSNQTLRFKNIDVDNSGNVYVLGQYSGTIDFNPSISATYTSSALGGNGIPEAFLIKLNSSGTFQWVSFVQSSINISGLFDLDLTHDNSDNMLFTQTSEGPIQYKTSTTLTNLPTTYSPVSNTTVWLFKVNSTGQLLFTKQFYASLPSDANYRTFDIKTDHQNNIFIVGACEMGSSPKTIFIDSDFSYLHPANQIISYLTKYNSNGVFQYTTRTNATNSLINILPNNDVNMLSFTENGGDFKYTDVNNNLSTVPLFCGIPSYNSVLSLSTINNSTGVLTYHKNLLKYSSLLNNYPLPIFHFDNFGNFYFVNHPSTSSGNVWFDLLKQTSFSVTVINDPNRPVNITRGLVKFDKNGDFLMSTPSFNSGKDFCVDNLQNIYLTGICSSNASSMDLDPGSATYNIPIDNIFITKLSFCQPPNVTLTAPTSSVCINIVNGSIMQSVFIKVNSIGTTPSYTFSSNFNWTPTNGSHYPDSSMIKSQGTYTVIVNNQCDFASKGTASVNINIFPPVLCSIDKTLPCNGVGGSYTITSSSGSSTFHTTLWNNGVTTDTNTPIFPGQVSTFTVTDINGCKYSSSNLVMDAEYQVSLQPIHYSYCGYSTQLNAQQISGTGLTNYSWLPATNINNPNISNPMVSPTQNTTYTLTSENQGCFKTYTTNISVYNLSNFTYTTSGLSVTFTNPILPNPNFCPNFIWDFGNGMQNSLATNPSVTYNNSGLYTACMKCTNLPQECVACATFSLPANTSGGTDVGIVEQKNITSNLHIYPIPSEGQFFIEVEKEFSVEITNFLGQIIFRQDLIKGKNIINLYEYPNGIYFLKEKCSYSKLVKQ